MFKVLRKHNLILSFSNPKNIQNQPKKSLDENAQLAQQKQFQNLTDYEKSFSYIHSKNRKHLSLYNIFSFLPLSFAKHLGRMIIHDKTIISSDQIYFPKIVEDGIPLYDSLYNGTLIKVVKSLQFTYIPFALICKMPIFMLSTIPLHFLIYYRDTFTKIIKSMVIKMQLKPSTEEIIYQKIGFMGRLVTKRVSINDLEQIKIQENQVFKSSSKAIINQKLLFRVVSTGELLMFDKDGVWHEKGINDPLIL